METILLLLLSQASLSSSFTSVAMPTCMSHDLWCNVYILETTFQRSYLLTSSLPHHLLRCYLSYCLCYLCLLFIESLADYPLVFDIKHDVFTICMCHFEPVFVVYHAVHLHVFLMALVLTS